MRRATTGYVVPLASVGTTLCPVLNRYAFPNLDKCRLQAPTCSERLPQIKGHSPTAHGIPPVDPEFRNDTEKRNNYLDLCAISSKMACKTRPHIVALRCAGEERMCGLQNSSSNSMKVRLPVGLRPRSCLRTFRIFGKHSGYGSCAVVKCCYN